MKKYSYLLIFALALTAFLPGVVRAESGSSDSSSDDTTEVEVEIENESSDDDSNDDSRSKGLPILREQLRIKTNNIEINREIRNKEVNGRLATSSRSEIKDFRTMGSTTRGERIEIREERREEVGLVREETRERIKNASSSQERREERREMRRDVFEIRKNALTRQLNVSLNNLKQLSERIASRIDKALENGKDMSKAQSLLILADAKIDAAELAIAELGTFVSNLPVASSTATTASSTIDLTKPREVGEKAIQAIKEAHKALVETIKAVAQSLGTTKTATTTPPLVLPPTTGTSTATTTATTTTL